MSIIESYIKPYLFWFKVAAIAIVLSVAFFGGCSVQKNRDAVTIQKKNEALRDASRSLSAAATALQAQNEENAKLIAANEQSKKDAMNAGVLSDAEREAAGVRIKGFENQLKSAQKNEMCKALLTADIKKVCEL